MWAVIKTITHYSPAAKGSVRGMNLPKPAAHQKGGKAAFVKHVQTPIDGSIPAANQNAPRQGSFGGLKVPKSALPSLDESSAHSSRVNLRCSAQQAEPTKQNSPRQGSFGGQVAKSALPSLDESSAHSSRANLRSSAQQAEPSNPSKGFVRGIASQANAPSKMRPRKSMDPIEALGRTMARILRHQAVELNLPLRPDGYVPVHELLSLGIKTQAGIPLRAHSILDLEQAVQEDNKQRFTLLKEDGKLFIRASQGHSIEAVKSGELLHEILSAEEVPVCVHGTYKRYLSSILENGLCRMRRNHVHFASGLPNEGGVISGMRTTCQVLIYLDVEKALTDGMKLYMSDNKVILTEGFDGIVPPKYFVKVVEWPSRKQLYPSTTDTAE